MAEIDNIINEPSEAEKRIKQLSSKVKEEAENRETERKAREEAEAKAASAQKEAEFYKNFAAVSSRYAGSAEKIDEIKAKVMAGYDMEDAAIAVVTRSAPVQPVVDTPVAGGSAVTNPPQQGGKSLSDMSTDEKRQILMENQDELVQILTRPR